MKPLVATLIALAVLAPMRAAAGAGAAAPPVESPAKRGEPSRPAAKAKVAELPPRVQAAVREHAAGREVVDIEVEHRDGQFVYEVEFRSRGLNERIHVAEDGRLVRDDRLLPELKTIFPGTQPEDLPLPVQATLQRVVKGREIVEVDRRGPIGEPIYVVQVRNVHGIETLQIAPDGKLLLGNGAGARSAP